MSPGIFLFFWGGGWGGGGVTVFKACIPFIFNKDNCTTNFVQPSLSLSLYFMLHECTII